MTVLRIALPTPLRQLFDYLAPADFELSQIQCGARVWVPFQKRELIGIIVETTEESEFPLEKLKPVTQLIDKDPIFPHDIWQLCLWAADYYHYALGEIFAAALPAHLREGKAADKKFKKKKETPSQTHLAIPPHALNSAQKNAIEAIETAQDRFQVFLLDGVTGSGKTEVYLQSMLRFLEQGKQVLILIPEIGLTPQTIQRFRERFSLPVLALHSGLTKKERFEAWQLAKSGEAKIIIGTRSAVFTPFAALGLIIIDEEHDPSFKQQEGFRYHARDLAIMRAHLNQIPIVMGSATPSLETLQNTHSGRYQHLPLPQRAGAAQLPEFQILDVRKKPLEAGLSPTLLNEIKAHLAAGNQAMLFLNRRGFAPVLMCHSCGWAALCKRCDARMTYHHHTAKLHCHHCDHRERAINSCGHCKEPSLFPLGTGTERLEKTLSVHFPEISIARLDRDTTRRKGELDLLLEKINSGEHQILIGTQMLAKGHHFPNVTLVGIIDTDHGFFSADFRALERTGQLLLQVAGRSGRSDKPGKVLIQTHHPDHPFLQQLIQHGYSAFAHSLLKERRLAALPPFAFFALFRAEAHRDTQAMTFLQEVKKVSEQSSFQHLTLLGPVPAPMPKRAGRHRAQLLIQSAHRPSLQQFLKKILPKVEKLPGKHKVQWSVDVDPIETY